MGATVLVCGRIFDGTSEELSGQAEVLIEGNRIANVARSVNRPTKAQVIDLSDHVVAPGFIDRKFGTVPNLENAPDEILY